MKRTILAAALAAVAASATPAASAYSVRFCGMTYQPRCDVCYDGVCVPVTVGGGSR